MENEGFKPWEYGLYPLKLKVVGSNGIEHSISAITLNYHNKRIVWSLSIIQSHPQETLTNVPMLLQIKEIHMIYLRIDAWKTTFPFGIIYVPGAMILVLGSVLCITSRHLFLRLKFKQENILALTKPSSKYPATSEGYGNYHGWLIWLGYIGDDILPSYI